MSLLRCTYLMKGTLMLLVQLFRRENQQANLHKLVAIVTILGSALSFMLKHEDKDFCYWPLIIWNVVSLYLHLDLTGGFEHGNLVEGLCSYAYVGTNALTFGPMCYNSPDEIAEMIELLQIWLRWIFVCLMDMQDLLLGEYRVYTCLVAAAFGVFKLFKFICRRWGVGR